MKLTRKTYEIFLIFFSNIEISKVNILSLYYKNILKKWRGKNIETKIYFLKINQSIIFCLKIKCIIFPFQINLLRNLIKLNKKLRKYLITNLQK